MKTLNEVWPILIVAFQLFQALVLYSFRETLKNLRLEMRLTLAQEHYNKTEIDAKVAEVTRNFAIVPARIRSTR